MSDKSIADSSNDELEAPLAPAAPERPNEPSEDLADFDDSLDDRDTEPNFDLQILHQAGLIQ